MRLQPLLLCKELGFKAIPHGYGSAAISNGHRKFVERYLEGDIACKRVTFIEQFNAPTAIGGSHKRAPIAVIIYGTKAQIAVIQDPFIVQVTNETFDTHKPTIKAWLRVGGSRGDAGPSYPPLLIVRDSPEVALTRVDTFFRPAIQQIERNNYELALDYGPDDPNPNNSDGLSDNDLRARYAAEADRDYGACGIYID